MNDMQSNKVYDIALGCDQNGLELKNEVAIYLTDLGYKVKDLGVHAGEDTVYPEIAFTVCQDILKNNIKRAILICGTGAGMAIAANKVKGIRAVCIHDAYTAERARASNDAQVATIGSLVVGIKYAKKLIDIWLASEFEGGRSVPKVEWIRRMEDF